MYEKSINFLLENAGPVIIYRLHKEILRDLSEANENKLLEKVYNMPRYKLLKKFIKPNGYIGIDMHGGDKYKETPLQDGETAARLLSYYSIPKANPVIKNFIQAIRNDEILKDEFSFSNSAVKKYEERFLGLNSGYGLMVLIYTIQAMLGYGDNFEDVKNFQNISLKSFTNTLNYSSLKDMTKPGKSKTKKYNYPYIEGNTFFPCAYHLTTLAYTNTWRTKSNLSLMANAINHLSIMINKEYNIHIKIGSNYYVPLWAFTRPLKTFSAKLVPENYAMYRRVLTEIAMLGIGGKVNIIIDSVINLEKEIAEDGILRIKFCNSYQKSRYLKMLEFPTAYSEISLEEDYRKPNALECDLTFWALQFLTTKKTPPLPGELMV